MQLSGIADEAGSDLASQIAAHRELGWGCIDIRDVDGVNFTDVEDRVFDAGEGVGRIDAILADLLAGGYDGTIAIEPHMTGLAAMRDPSITPERVRADYVAYGRQLEDLIARARQGAGS